MYTSEESRSPQTSPPNTAREKYEQKMKQAAIQEEADAVAAEQKAEREADLERREAEHHERELDREASAARSEA